MIVPDITGLTLGEARKTFESAGLSIDRITVLTPPRDKSNRYDESYRVIRLINIENDKFEIQICKPL